MSTWKRSFAAAAVMAAIGVFTGAASAHPLDGGTIDCAGDGTSGKRIQAIYGHTAAADNSGTAIPLIKNTMAPRVDKAYDLSAQLDVTGATHAHPRWVCTGGVLDVINLTVSDTESQNLNALLANPTIAALRANPSRKYLVWMDSPSFLAIATMPPDERPDPGVNNGNGNNGWLADVGMITTPGWDSDTNDGDGISVAYAPQHELAHMLGAVHEHAPHVFAGHTLQGQDAMLIDPGPGGPAQILDACPAGFDPPYFALLDCRNDDYFASNPPQCTYLATNWNIYNSGFLDTSAPQVPQGCPAIPGGPGPGPDEPKCKKKKHKRGKKRAAEAKKKKKKGCKKKKHKKK